MAKILLDYFFKIIAINPTPAASTAYLKQACLVVKPKGGYGGAIGTPVLCTTNAQIAAITDNVEGQQFLNAGLSRVYIMPVNDLLLDNFLAAAPAVNKFFTLVVSSDFTDAEITPTQAALTINGDLTFTAVESGSGGNAITVALVNDDGITAGDEEVEVTGTDIVISIDSGVSTATQIKAAYDAAAEAVALATCSIVSGQGAAAQAAAAEAPLAGGDGLSVGPFKGVIGGASTDSAFAATMAAKENYAWFKTSSANKTKNCCFAFGKLLSIPGDWKNQQYVTMPYDDSVDVLGDADSLFDDKVSFVITDDEFGSRLALFAAGGKAIVAPYIIRNLEIDLQSKGLQYVSANQPGYTLTQAALLEDELQKVIDGDGLENGNPGYIGKGWITSGKVDVTLPNDNFVAGANIAVPTPRALWRINGIITQS